jgi:hypothetical protein
MSDFEEAKQSLQASIDMYSEVAKNALNPIEKSMAYANIAILKKSMGGVSHE